MNLEKISQNFTQEFPGDKSGSLMPRQTTGLLYSLAAPAGFPDARLIHLNEKLANEIGLGTFENQQDEDFLNANPSPAFAKKSYATAYAGHQFGNWAGQLGDGRAIFAGEIVNDEGKAMELQWKGAGATPYSRHADGRAVLRSTVREYLMSEAMHHLNVPTTRALSISLTGEDVVRDIMYSGQPAEEPGALMVRTAPSFIRFGHFEFLFASGEAGLTAKLADYIIENHYPEISSSGAQKYLDFFSAVCKRTANLMAEWMRVGFVHGVMNTDNMSALGLTIDYGPFSMLDAFDLAFTPNTTDLPGGRYAFGEQPKIAQWNLWQLANALHPLINDGEALQEILDNFGGYFWNRHDLMMVKKFGLDRLTQSDLQLFNAWQGVLQRLELDYTLFFQKLERPEAFGREELQAISYKKLTDTDLAEFQGVMNDYQKRLSSARITREDSLRKMRAANPRFILRNYLLFDAIEKLTDGERAPFDKLYSALQRPYENIFPEFNQKRPAKYEGVPGCSSLSCSS